MLHGKDAEATPCGLVTTIGPGRLAQNLPFAVKVVMFDPTGSTPFTFFGETLLTVSVDCGSAFVAVTVRMKAPAALRVTSQPVT